MGAGRGVTGPGEGVGQVPGLWGEEKNSAVREVGAPGWKTSVGSDFELGESWCILKKSHGCSVHFKDNQQSKNVSGTEGLLVL